MQQREMPLIELVLWMIVPTSYVTLVFVVAKWVAQLLGVEVVWVAIPLVSAPLVLMFRRHWRHAWVIVTPVAAAAFVVLLTWRKVHFDWQWPASMTGSVMCVWLPVMLAINRMRLRRSDRT